jgi:Glutamine amidotransferases class-II
MLALGIGTHRTSCPPRIRPYRARPLTRRFASGLLFLARRRIEKALEASVAVFHQRFSTNTLPQWRLAHPPDRAELAHSLAAQIAPDPGSASWT